MEAAAKEGEAKVAVARVKALREEAATGEEGPGQENGVEKEMGVEGAVTLEEAVTAAGRVKGGRGRSSDSGRAGRADPAEVEE